MYECFNEISDEKLKGTLYDLGRCDNAIWIYPSTEIAMVLKSTDESSYYITGHATERTVTDKVYMAYTSNIKEVMYNSILSGANLDSLGYRYLGKAADYRTLVYKCEKDYVAPYAMSRLEIKELYTE